MKLDSQNTPAGDLHASSIVVRRATVNDKYSVVPNGLLRDPDLDDEARGFLVRILSNTDEFLTDHYHSALSAWQFEKHVAENAGRKAPHGKTWYEKAFTRLTQAGYKTNERHRRDDGSFYVVVTFSDTKLTDTEEPSPGKPGTGKPGTGNPGDRGVIPAEKYQSSSSGDDDGAKATKVKKTAEGSSSAKRESPRPSKDGYDDLAASLVKEYPGLGVGAGSMARALRSAAAQRPGVNDDILSDVLLWWLMGDAPIQFGILSKDQDGPGRRTTGAARA